MADKILRKQLREKRRNIPIPYKSSAAENLAANFNIQLMQDINTQQHKVGIYLALKEEINLQPLIKMLWQNSIKTFCPILHPLKPRHLFFIEYTKSTPLTTDKFGIATPIFNADIILAPWELDIVFTPLVGFDANGNRIGMGAGFYDTSFAYRSLFKNETILIGCAFDCQKLDNIKANNWDQPLNAILTESGYLNCDN
jgi:5-formyltetrahydrofolate cyclo-ligase